MLVKAAPPVLALHLKRFKYIESLGRYKKLMHRVVFPNELKLNNMVRVVLRADIRFDPCGSKGRPVSID